MSLRAFTLAVAIGLFAGPVQLTAQESPKVPRIGYLSYYPDEQHKLLAAFKQGLKELGYVEGENIIIERREAQGKQKRLPGLIDELLRLKVDIIVTGAQGARVAKKATSTIPIVMTYDADPVGAGDVASLAHPGGNVTGLSDYHRDLVTKRLGLLREIDPSISRVAALFNPANSVNRPMLQDTEAAAPKLGLALLAFAIKGPEDIDRAFAMSKEEGIDGLLQFVGLGRYQRRMVALAAKNRVPAVYTRGQWVTAGGLMSYGSSWPDLHRRAAIYVDKILNGAKPGDLPIEQPTKFELVINLKTAKHLGLTIPPSILYRADEVIK